MERLENDIIRWYVVGTLSVHREIRIRDYLRLAGMECYVPLRYEIKRTKGEVVRKMVPAITGLVFARVSYNEFKEYAKTARDALFLKRSTFSNHQELLTVNDYDMERFIALTTALNEDITYFRPEEVTLHEGELVEVQLGSRTYEAEIKRVNGKRSKQLVVEIPGVAAAITLTPEVMKVLKRLSSPTMEAGRQKKEEKRKKKLAEEGKSDLRKSRNLETDKRMLTETARRLLFEVTPEHIEDVENQMAMVELRRLRERVAPYKGFTAQAEGELALAMYLASVKLGTEVETAELRMENAIAALKDTSILKLRMRYYLAMCRKDVEALQAIEEVVKGWNKLNLSARQKEMIEDMKLKIRN